MYTWTPFYFAEFQLVYTPGISFFFEEAAVVRFAWFIHTKCWLKGAETLSGLCQWIRFQLFIRLPLPAVYISWNFEMQTSILVYTSWGFKHSETLQDTGLSFLRFSINKCMYENSRTRRGCGFVGYRHAYQIVGKVWEGRGQRPQFCFRLTALSLPAVHGLSMTCPWPGAGNPQIHGPSIRTGKHAT